MMSSPISRSVDMMKATPSKVPSITLNTPNDITQIVSRVHPSIVNEGDYSNVITFELNMEEAAVFG
jgi:hypothetical protein